MEIIAYEMSYAGQDIEESAIVCIPFDKSYFQEYMLIYNACFYKMREALGIEPYNVLQDYEQVREKSKDIFLLVQEKRVIGSVACFENEIDDLIVREEEQNKGCGRQLLLWGMAHIRERSKAPITLHVAKWNEKAVRLYESIGFEITRVQRVR